MRMFREVGEEGHSSSLFRKPWGSNGKKFTHLSHVSFCYETFWFHYSENGHFNRSNAIQFWREHTGILASLRLADYRRDADPPGEDVALPPICPAALAALFSAAGSGPSSGSNYCTAQLKWQSSQWHNGTASVSPLCPHPQTVPCQNSRETVGQNRWRLRRPAVNT